MCKRTEENVWSNAGLSRHTYKVGFFNVPIQAQTRGTIFTIILRNLTPSIAHCETALNTNLTYLSRTGIKSDYNFKISARP